MATAPSSRLTLESGDRLTPEEFDRIYEQMPDVRAELINGVVYVSSPVKIVGHAEPHAWLLSLATVYCSRHEELRVFGDGSYYTEAGDRAQPDVCLFRRNGGAYVDDDGYLKGAPEFIAEVAFSSAAYDLHDKLDVYRRAGVREYLVWRVHDEAFDFFAQQGSDYSRVEPDADGILESREFPGLRIDTRELIAGNLAAALAALG